MYTFFMPTHLLVCIDPKITLTTYLLFALKLELKATINKYEKMLVHNNRKSPFCSNFARSSLRCIDSL